MCSSDLDVCTVPSLVCILGLEVLEQLEAPEVVVVCCGGGGLLAGVAAALRLSGCSSTRVYGVEPEGGRTALTGLYWYCTLLVYSHSILVFTGAALYWSIVTLYWSLLV